MCHLRRTRGLLLLLVFPVVVSSCATTRTEQAAQWIRSHYLHETEPDEILRKTVHRLGDTTASSLAIEENAGSMTVTCGESR